MCSPPVIKAGSYSCTAGTHVSPENSSQEENNRTSREPSEMYTSLRTSPPPWPHVPQRTVEEVQRTVEVRICEEQATHRSPTFENG